MNASLEMTHDKAGEVIFCYGANRSFRREALKGSHFDTDLLYFDDYDMNLQLREEGIRIYYDPAIQRFPQREQTPRGERRFPGSLRPCGSLILPPIEVYA